MQTKTSPKRQNYTLHMVGVMVQWWLYCKHMFIVTTFHLGNNIILRQIVRGAGFSY